MNSYNPLWETKVAKVTYRFSAMKRLFIEGAEAETVGGNHSNKYSMLLTKSKLPFKSPLF